MNSHGVSIKKRGGQDNEPSLPIHLFERLVIK